MNFSRRDFIRSLGVGAGTFVALNVSGCSGGSDSDSDSGANPLWDTGDARNKIIIISDLHLGVDDNYTETLQNRPLLIKFLQSLQNTKDVRELVIAGDFLDEWYLPVYYYPLYTDQDQFYRNVIANNQSVFDELNKVITSGIKLVYVPGNHDLTLRASVLQAAIPGLFQASSENSNGDPQGLGAYYTGDRNEIVIEHGHRYDVFSAPDTISNEALCGNPGTTILPAGYFYARYAATWVLEGQPSVPQSLPEITDADFSAIQTESNIADQSGAYTYHKILRSISNRMTPYESRYFDAEVKIFQMRISGFNDDYSYKDFYPDIQTDGDGKRFISAPKLFKNIQTTWAARQTANKVKVPENTFASSVTGAVVAPAFPESYFTWAKANYLENPAEANVEVVVFGHTHVPARRDTDSGKCYLNSGTWIDHNANSTVGSRTFAVVTTGSSGKDVTALYQFVDAGNVVDVTATVSS
ncbi:metallophosphoesterase [Propionivibrio sp.]|uniref:metallophosphoesterase n=1 Tax=Propionivibrio sp. TaxID=2212460 RepID=UPI0039E40EE1